MGTKLLKGKSQLRLTDIEIPTVPEIASRVMHVATDPASSVNDIVRIISDDAAFTSKVLRMANSAFFSIGKEVNSLTQAVVRIGFNALKNIAITFSLREKFGSASFTERRLWDHSAVTAFACYYICKCMGGASEDEAFTAGLLHDIGKMPLKQSDEEYALFLENVYRGQPHPGVCIEFEENYFGFTHCEVCKVIMENWLFSQQLIKPILLHHAKSVEEINPQKNGLLPAIVFLGNLFSHELLINNKTPEDLSVLVKSIPNEILEFSDEQIVALAEQTFETYNAEKKFLGLDPA